VGQQQGRLWEISGSHSTERADDMAGWLEWL